jgi:hypothetical protein
MKDGVQLLLSAASTAMDEDLRADRRAERERAERFAGRFPFLASVPLLHGAFRALYRHGPAYVLILVLTVAAFTAIKAPYFSAPFTGEHSMKYNTYVEPAYYMLQKDSMLWNQKKYVADPVHNPEGIFPRFDHLPLMEWGLYLTFRLFPDAGMELKTRLFTHVIGVLILVCGYLFFCRYFPKRFCALFVILLALNPVFSFSTYVTVLDSIALLFMFLSLLQLGAAIDQGKVAGLLGAATWFGLGNAVKYPLFLWLAPIAFLFIYFADTDRARFLRDFTIYVAVSLAVTAAAVVVTRLLIPAPRLAVGMALAASAALLVGRRELQRHQESVDRGFSYLWNHKAALGAVVALSVLAGLVAFRLSRLSDFEDEFLTDPTLVANYRLYKYMLLQQFKNYMTRNLFWLGVGGGALALLTREKAMRRVWLPFAFGSLVYWVVASKSIFFHIYYSLIIVLTLTAGAAYFIDFVVRNFRPDLQRIVVYLCFLSLLVPPILDETTGRMKNYVPVENAIRYIKENTRPDEFILFEGYLTPLSIYTGRGFVMPAVLIDDAIRRDIRTIGFAETMRKYKVKYLFTPYERPYYADFAPIFEETGITEPSGTNFNRIITIYKTIGVSDPEISKDLREVEKVEEKYDIKDKFVLASRVGRFGFYTFQN